MTKGRMGDGKESASRRGQVLPGMASRVGVSVGSLLMSLMDCLPYFSTSSAFYEVRGWTRSHLSHWGCLDNPISSKSSVLHPRKVSVCFPRST